MTLSMFPPKRFVLRSELPLSVCEERLRAQVGGLWALPGGKPLRGWVNPEGFDVRILRWTRAWRFHARGMFVPDAIGTRVDITYGPQTLEEGVVLVLVIAALGLGLA